MAGPQEISLTSTDIDAVLTGYRWDTNDLTFSFPDSRWWYILDAVLNELDPLDVVEALGDWLADPVGGFIDALGTAVLGDYDAGVIAVIALNGFEEFNAAQEATARFGMNSAAALTNLTFSETILEIDAGFDPLPYFNVTFGDLRFAESDSISSTSPAFGVPPIQRFETLLGRSFLGDMWFKGDGRFDAPQIGNYAFMTIMHELGHALGLKHAHEAGLLGSEGILNDILTDIDGPILRNALNSIEFTIMTYRSALNGSNSLVAEKYGYAQSFMMLDIAALQYMYGADFTTNADNTTYMWDPNDGTMSINGVRQGTPGAGAAQTDIDNGLTNRVFLTIWDGNGNDTYDMSNYTTPVSIDLRPAFWSITSDAQRADLNAFDGGLDANGNRLNDRTMNLAQGNVYNAFQYNNDPRSLIENAIGGSGNDTIRGNDIANLLRGNGGNDNIIGGLGQDTLEGGAGNDTLDGGADNDTLIGNDGDDSLIGGDGADSIDGGAGNDTIDGGADNDTVMGGDGNDSILGADGADTIDAGAGNDTVLGGAGNDTIQGGEGNDSIDGGSENDILNGGAGNDTIVGGDGNDSILAGAGNDSVQGGNGIDTVFGGDGNDTIDGGNEDDFLAGEFGNDSIIGAGGNDSITGADGFDTLFGGAGMDTLDGGADSDFLDGGDDADLLNAGAGNDTVFGGSGNDTITAGDGDDSVLGGIGLDSIDAGSGNDTVFGGGDADTIIGGAGLDSIDGGDGADYIDGGVDADNLAGGDGDDTILGALGADIIVGGAGADSIDAGGDDDWVSGGDGNDTIYGGDGNDTIFGDAGNDLVHAGNGLDSVRGGAGDDDLFGEDGVDSLFGDEGNDTLAGGSGPDTVDGGDGIDMASYLDATGPVVINLQDWSQTTGDAQGDVLISIEQFGLSNFDDTFIGLDDPLNGDVVFGRGGNDTLLGFAGDDELYGEDGDDYIVGGEGADVIDGGNGFDTTDFRESNIGIVVDLVTPSRNTGIAEGDTIVSIEQFHMTFQNDEFVGLAADETIFGYHGNDTISGNGGDDHIYGGEQHDLLFGGDGNDALFGEAGDDTLVGGAGNDSLDGGLGIDDLRGGAGDDLLWGGVANDRLAGGAGNDILWGGADRDTFVYGASGWGQDILMDFQDRYDRIEITGLPGGPGIHAMNDLLIFDRMGAGGIETVIQLASGGTDQIVLVGISANQINHQDFTFLA